MGEPTRDQRKTYLQPAITSRSAVEFAARLAASLGSELPGNGRHSPCHGMPILLIEGFEGGVVSLANAFGSGLQFKLDESAQGARIWQVSSCGNGSASAAALVLFLIDLRWGIQDPEEFLERLRGEADLARSPAAFLVAGGENALRDWLSTSNRAAPWRVGNQPTAKAVVRALDAMLALSLFISRLAPENSGPVPA